MSHDLDIKDTIKIIVEKIAQALNAEQSDYAEIKSYNKLAVYDGPHGLPLAFEVVVRLPMEPNELESYRQAKARKRLWRGTRS